MSAAAAPAPPAGIDELRALTRDLLAHDAWPRERLLDHQRERLRATLRHAVAASPYYREVLGPDAAAPDVDLASLPILPKETLVERFDDIVTDPRLRLADLEAHLAGPDAAQPYLGAYRAFSTSGTSGLRALVVYDRDDMADGHRVEPARRRAPGRRRPRRASSRSARRTRCTSRASCSPRSGPGGRACRS